MDRHFLEFWGHLMLNAAKGQKQLEEMTQWVNQGYGHPAFKTMTDLFAKFYGMTLPRQPQDEAWREALKTFQKSFDDYLALMGMVSKTEHLALQKKYDQLKAKCDKQEETIAHLRKLLSAGGASQESLVKGFEDIVASQTQQLQNLMESSKRYFEEATRRPKKK